jgi:hypothetical protein
MHNVMSWQPKSGIDSADEHNVENRSGVRGICGILSVGKTPVPQDDHGDPAVAHAHTLP